MMVVEGRQLKGIGISRATSCDDVERTDWTVKGKMTGRLTGGDNGVWMILRVGRRRDESIKISEVRLNRNTVEVKGTGDI